MVTLQELTKLYEEKILNDVANRLRIIKERDEKLENEYLSIVEPLEDNLITVAKAGYSSLYVAHFSVYSLTERTRNVTEELHKRRGDVSNYWLAWNLRVITEKDIIECMCGNAKRVYDFLMENNLNPIITYWTNDSDEGFQFHIYW
jgi:hypothetical protein